MFHLCLVVSRDWSSAQKVTTLIGSPGIKSYAVDSISSALSLAAQLKFDVVLLDADGFGSRVAEMIAQLTGKGLPVLVVASGAGEDEQLRWMRHGATEVVIRPASARLVGMKVVRVAKIGHPPKSVIPRQVHLGPLMLDTDRICASVDAMPLDLTSREFELLLVLATKPGGFVHRRSIAHALGLTSARGGRSVDMLVCRIRSKLRHIGEERLQLKTVYGLGYALGYVTPNDREPGMTARYRTAGT